MLGASDCQYGMLHQPMAALQLRVVFMCMLYLEMMTCETDRWTPDHFTDTTMDVTSNNLPECYVIEHH